MTARRPLLKNRRVWRTHLLNRIWRQRQATDLAGLLALEGNCAIPGTGWTDAEIRHANAPHSAAAAEAARSVLELCDDCPVIGECAQWAHVDRYTGLAAGSSWIRGQEYDPTTTINNPRPKNTAAA